VKDTVAGFLAVMRSEKAVGEVVNVGSDFEVSIGDAADIIAALMGRKITIRVDEQRLRPDASEVERLWAATEKAKALTDWRPDYSGREGFQRGLTETIAWFKDPRNLAGYDPSRYQV
jgi:dTDP-glucose 4,6-dehydratase